MFYLCGYVVKHFIMLTISNRQHIAMKQVFEQVANCAKCFFFFSYTRLALWNEISQNLCDLMVHQLELKLRSGWTIEQQ